MQIVAGRGVDLGSASPISRQHRAEPVVEIIGAGLNVVPWLSAILPDRVAMQIIEVQTGPNLNLVDERDRIRKREHHSAAVASAEEAAPSAAAAAAVSATALSAATAI